MNFVFELNIYFEFTLVILAMAAEEELGVYRHMVLAFLALEPPDIVISLARSSLIPPPSNLLFSYSFFSCFKFDLIEEIIDY